jgi:gliding motility-associated-like protein
MSCFHSVLPLITVLARPLATTLLPAFLLLVPARTEGQVHNIANGDFTGCNGTLTDSGGDWGLGYGDNEDLVSVICPGTPGEAISLQFILGDLDTSGPAPLDQIVVHDGNSTAAPVLGTFSGSTLAGAVVVATPANPTGCLTVHFTSNSTGSGAFIAAISCTTPCIAPTATATLGETLPALVCTGEVLSFDATGSAAAPGSTLASVEWDFADGTTAQGMTVTHTFNTPGEYVVQLVVTDENGCVNMSPVLLPVWVGTQPVFVGTTMPASICEGGTVTLTGVAQPTTWTGVPEVELGGPIPLPDNVGTPFTNQIEFSGFPVGSTVTSASDIVSICVDMEHSFMGDLVISMICPTGQSLTLHQQGGGGTFLGDANDTEPAGTPAVPGTCWEYCWAPNATLGTWANCAQFGPTPNVMPSSQGISLIPGTYSSVGSFNSLVGCPLNGNWTLSVTDMLFIDNGVICGWSITFADQYYSNITSFTPTIGSTTDSSYWSGPGVVNDPDNPGTATVVTDQPGTFDYTYTVIDNFGCSYDTTLTLVVRNAPQVGATMTLGATCSDPATLSASIVAFPPPPTFCTYQLVLHDDAGNGWSGGASVLVNYGTGQSNFTMSSGSQATYSITVQTGQPLTVTYTAGANWNQQNSFEIIGPDGTVLYSSPQGPSSGVLWTGTANCGPGTGPLVYTWSPAGSVANPGSPNTTAMVTEPTEVVVMVHPSDAPYCFTTDTLLVMPPSFIENDSVVVHANCFAEDGSIQVITTGPGGPWDYQWSDAQGTVVATTTAADGDTFTGPAGTYTVIVVEGVNGNGCTDTLTATIIEPPLLEWVTTPSDTTICLTGTATLGALAHGGTAPINLQWTGGPSGNGPHTLSPAQTTTYSVQAVDAHGCTTSVHPVTVSVLPPLSFTPLEPDTECFGIPVPYAVLDAAGGDGAYQYNWGSGPQSSSAYEALLPNTANVCVTLTDGCETPAITSCAQLVILHTPPLVITADTTEGCVPFNVRFDLQDTTGQAIVDWDFGDVLEPGQPTTVHHTYTVGGDYTVGVQVLWPNGCVTDTSIANMIHVLTVPNAHASWSPHPPSILDPVVQFTDESVPNVVSWWWDFGELGTSTEQHPEVTFPGEVGNSYPVTLVVANALGCTDTLRTIVDVNDELMVFVPNAFTPDGLGGNEVFRVMSNDIAPDDFEMIIFDRWGREVFSTNDLYKGWDGSMGGNGGEILPQSVYVYKLKVVSMASRNKRDIIGHVTLLR